MKKNLKRIDKYLLYENNIVVTVGNNIINVIYYQ